MKKALSLLLTIAMMTSMLAACSSDDTTASDTSTSTSDDTSSSQAFVTEGENVVSQADLVAADGEPEGVVAGTSAVICSGSDFVTLLLPGMFNGGQFFYTLVYDTLFWSPSGEWDDLEGLLVTDYTISDDGLTWVMNLQEDVYFHNGTQFTAESVIGSFDYYEENGHGTGLDSVDLYEATGEHQVTLHLNSINPELEYNLAISNIAIFDHNCYLEYGYTVDAAMGAGSGPYYIDSYAIGDNVVLKAEENYWMEERQAHIETVTMQIITNTETAFNALASGAVDYGGLSSYTYYEIMRDDADYTIVTYEGRSNIIWMNSGGSGGCEYLANENVRKAIDLLVDDEQVMLAATGGYGVVGGNPLNEAFNDYYYSEYEYDVEAGLALLEAEGVDPSDISITALVVTGMDASFSNIQSQLMDHGIELNFVATDPNVVMTEGMAGNWDMWLEGGGLGGLPYYCAAQSNIWGSNAVQVVIPDEDLWGQVADITTQATSCLTVEDTYEYFAQACEILDDAYTYITVWTGDNWCCFNNRIENLSIDLNTGWWRVFDSWIAE